MHTPQPSTHHMHAYNTFGYILHLRSTFFLSCRIRRIWSWSWEAIATHGTKRVCGFIGRSTFWAVTPPLGWRRWSCWRHRSSRRWRQFSRLQLLERTRGRTQEPWRGYGIARHAGRPLAGPCGGLYHNVSDQRPIAHSTIIHLPFLHAVIVGGNLVWYLCGALDAPPT